MKLPPLVGIFPSQFPGWGRDKEPVKHRTEIHRVGPKGEMLSESGPEVTCDMAFHPPGGPCMSARYIPVGVSGIDHDGRCWVLVDDLALSGKAEDGSWRTQAQRLRWVVFPTEVGEA